AISRETIEGFTRELALVQRSALGPEEKLRRVVRQHVRFVIANRSFLTVFFSEEPSLPPRIARALAAQKDRYDKGVEAIVAEGVRRGVFRDVPPRLVVFGMLGMLNWLYKWYNPAGRCWGAGGEGVPPPLGTGGGEPASASPRPRCADRRRRSGRPSSAARPAGRRSGRRRRADRCSRSSSVAAA